MIPYFGSSSGQVASRKAPATSEVAPHHLKELARTRAVLKDSELVPDA